MRVQLFLKPNGIAPGAHQVLAVDIPDGKPVDVVMHGGRSFVLRDGVYTEATVAYGNPTTA